MHRACVATLTIASVAYGAASDNSAIMVDMPANAAVTYIESHGYRFAECPFELGPPKGVSTRWVKVDEDVWLELRVDERTDILTGLVAWFVAPDATSKLQKTRRDVLRFTAYEDGVYSLTIKPMRDLTRTKP